MEDHKVRYPVLVLNSDYLPHRIIDWKQGFVLTVCKDNKSARTLCTYQKVIHDSVGRTYNLPAVIILNDYISNNNKPASYSKKTIMLRDKYICQYCGRKFEKNNLTIDHITPKSKANKLPKNIKVNSFENCVTSCLKCNSYKNDRTPKEANMKLLRQPKTVTRGQKTILEIHSRKIPNEWREYVEYL